MQPFCYWLLVETIVEYNFNITYSSENEFRELDLFRALVFLGGIVKKTTTNTLHRNSSSTARHATWCKILVLSMYYQNKPQVTPNNSVVDGSNLLFEHLSQWTVLQLKAVHNLSATADFIRLPVNLKYSFFGLFYAYLLEWNMLPI